MRITYKQYRITEKFYGNKAWSIAGCAENYNNHVITVINTGTKKRTRFDYWSSLANPGIVSEEALFEAFNCFIDDALSGIMNFEEFCGEFCYSSDSIKALKVYNACKAASKKADRVIEEDLHEFAEDLRDFLEAEVML